MTAEAYGIPLALLTTSAFNTGLILEKRALGRMPALNLGKVGQVIVALLSSPAWLAGFALMLTGLALQVIVLTFEPISLVQPILAAGVALTLVLSRLVLHERLAGAEFTCVVVMAASLVLLALSQDAAGGKNAQYASTLAMAAVIVPSLAAGLLIAVWGTRRPAATGIGPGIGVGLLYGVGSLATKGLSGIVTRDHTVVGLGIGIVSSPYLYLLVGCSAVALVLYQAALQACRASILIPITNVVSSVYFVVVGTWLFHERLPATPVKLALRLAGIAAAGVVLIALSRNSSNQGSPGPSNQESPGQISSSPASPRPAGVLDAD